MVFRDGAWGGVVALHKDYAVWCDQVARDVPAGFETFAKLLRETGSLMREDGLVENLLLREDWIAGESLRGSKNFANAQRGTPQNPQNESGKRA